MVARLIHPAGAGNWHHGTLRGSKPQTVVNRPELDVVDVVLEKGAGVQ